MSAAFEYLACLAIIVLLYAGIRWLSSETPMTIFLGGAFLLFLCSYYVVGACIGGAADDDEEGGP